VGFYNDVLLPHLLDRSMRNGALHEYRRRVVGAAAGRVLEVGIGSGLNLPFYGPNVTEIIGLEPSRPLIERASQRARANGRSVSFLPASAEAITVDAGSVDTIVTTWSGLMMGLRAARAQRVDCRAAMVWRTPSRSGVTEPPNVRSNLDVSITNGCSN
jgi:SAM-dependent methyltransferase